MWSDGEHNRHPTHHRIDIFVSIRPLLLSLFRFREPAKYEFVGDFACLGIYEDICRCVCTRFKNNIAKLNRRVYDDRIVKELAVH